MHLRDQTNLTTGLLLKKVDSIAHYFEANRILCLRPLPFTDLTKPQECPPCCPNVQFKKDIWKTVNHSSTTIIPTWQQTQQFFQLNSQHKLWYQFTQKYAVSVKLHGNRLTLQRWILISSEMKSYTKVKAPNDCEPTWD